METLLAYWRTDSLEYLREIFKKIFGQEETLFLLVKLNFDQF